MSPGERPIDSRLLGWMGVRMVDSQGSDPSRGSGAGRGTGLHRPPGLLAAEALRVARTYTLHRLSRRAQERTTMMAPAMLLRPNRSDGACTQVACGGTGNGTVTGCRVRGTSGAPPAVAGGFSAGADGGMVVMGVPVGVNGGPRPFFARLSRAAAWRRPRGGVPAWSERPARTGAWGPGRRRSAKRSIRSHQGLAAGARVTHRKVQIFRRGRRSFR